MPIEEIDHAAIARVVADQVEESEVLDFKRELYRWQGSKQEKVEARDELAKDVAAFANRRGGVLVLGVADVEDRASKMMPVSTVGRFDAWVRSTLASRVAPVPDVEVIQLDDPDTAGAGFILIVVPPSQQRPHAIYDPADKENALRYPYRIGRETHWWTAAQVALEHARARERIQLRSARREEVLGPAAAALGNRCWAVALVVPDVPGDMPITNAQMRELQQHKAHLESMFGNAWLPQTTRPIVGGFRQHSFADSEGAEIGGNLIDRYSDGSSIAAHELRVREGGASGRLPMLYTIDMLMWCLRTGLEHARQAGSYGTATVSCSLWWSNFSGQIAWATQNAFGSGYQAHGGPTIDGFLADAGVPVTVPLPSADSDDGTLLACRAALTPLVQRFGIPEVQQITEAGALDPRFTGSIEQAKRAAEALGWKVAMDGDG